MLKWVQKKKPKALNLHNFRGVIVAKKCKKIMERFDMVSLLVCSKDVAESKVLYSELTNDKGYEIENVSNKNDVLTKYWQINPDILVLDSNLVDLSIDNLMDRLSCSPIEQKNVTLF